MRDSRLRKMNVFFYVAGAQAALAWNRSMCRAFTCGGSAAFFERDEDAPSRGIGNGLQRVVKRRVRGRHGMDQKYPLNR